MSAQHMPGKLNPEAAYMQWRELHSLNGLAKPREWHELSEVRQRVWRTTVRHIFEDGLLAKATESTS